LNPLPDYLGGDVLSSSDPELAARRAEEHDPRERHVLPLLDRIERGDAVASELADLGVRWVVLLHEVDWQPLAALREDPGLRRTVTDTSVELFEVRAWRGPVVTSSGRVLATRQTIAPVARVDASASSRWQRPAAPGWLRGTERTGATAVGTLALPAGRGVIWFWPSLVVVVGYVCTVCGCLRSWCALQRSEPSVPSELQVHEQADGTP
jgi:hypothetical protein